MQGFESKAEDMILDARQKNGTRDAKAQSRQAPIRASISGQYVHETYSEEYIHTKFVPTFILHDA